MSKLSPTLKALINAPFARPGQAPAPARIADLYRSIAGEGAKNGLGSRPFLALSAAATFTLNSPDSLSALHAVATEAPRSETPVAAAEFIREVGLKCISFNGIPRTINCLGAFRAALPADVVASLSTTSSRAPSKENLDALTARGRGLWDSVYAPFENKLVERLADSHPDLPVHILNSHYGPLLSDPPAAARDGTGLASVGRVLTSVVAVSCLRSQTGVGPQVLSHVFGLRKAYDDGTYKTTDASEIEGAEWLATDDGAEWLIKSVDRIVEAIGGSNFAAGREAKL